MEKKKSSKSASVKKTMEERCKTNCSTFKCETSGSCLWFLGFVGAAFYYVSTAPTFWSGVWGLVKALVWPAFLVYEWMKYLGM